MFAPCGINCAVCYKHVGTKKPCQGCLKDDLGKPERCRNCKIKNCAQSKGLNHCFACSNFPCKLIQNIEKSYTKRYAISLIENSGIAKEKGIAAFLENDRQKWTCQNCGGAFSLHDGVCSTCGSTARWWYSQSTWLYTALLSHQVAPYPLLAGPYSLVPLLAFGFAYIAICLCIVFAKRKAYRKK